jgi:myo-inositol-1(or 4)-monophosphatase
MPAVQAHTELAVELARRAGALVRARYERQHELEFKGSRHNVVTEADHRSEQLIVAGIASAYPGHTVVAEEGRSQHHSREWTWYIDPLDGTNNFAHGFPHFCVSIALCRRDGPVSGVIYDPLRDELFVAEAGQRARVNGRPISVSSNCRLEESLVATGFPYEKAVLVDNNLTEFARVAPRVRGIRRAGSAALDLAYVAAGRLDGYWEAHLSPWDWAAGVLLVNEAGGSVSAYDGSPWRLGLDRLVASNGLVHAELRLTMLGQAVSAVSRGDLAATG